MIESERLLIRPVSMADLDDMFEYAKDEETGPRAGWPPHKTKEDSKKIIEMWLNPDYKERVFSIIYKADNKMIGTVGLQELNKVQKDSKNTYVKDLIKQGKKLIEIGITLSKQYWGIGIATEVIKMVKPYIFIENNADIAIATHFEANIGSKRAQEKNDMKEVYSFKSDENWFNTDCNITIVRAQTKEEWLERQAEIDKE